MFIAIIVVSWILATLAGTTLEFLDKKYRKFYGVIVTVVFFFVPLCIILGAYGAIFRVARAHARGRDVGSFRKVFATLDYQPGEPVFRLRLKRIWAGLERPWGEAHSFSLFFLPFFSSSYPRLESLFTIHRLLISYKLSHSSNINFNYFNKLYQVNQLNLFCFRNCVLP